MLHDDIEALIREIETAAQSLPREPDQMPEAGELAALHRHFSRWRQTVCGHEEGELRDRALWALLGAERHLRAVRDVATTGVNAPAARLRLEAAVRALRKMLPPLEPPPTP